MFASRCFYAVWNGILFSFDCKRDRDYFVAHGAQGISALRAYTLGILKAVNVESSYSPRCNASRKQNIEAWYNKRHKGTK